MSLDAINWAAQQKTGNATAKHVLLWLAYHANGKTGVCFPSIETLMDEMEVGSRNTVKAALRLLIDRGLITCVRKTAGSRVTSTLYTLNVDRSKTDPSNIDGSNSDASDIDADGSNFDSLMGQKLTPNKEIEQGINKEANSTSMRTSGNSSAIASAQAQTLPTSFPQSSNSQNHSETKTAGKDSLPNASERSVAAHRDRPDTSDEQTRQNDAGCSQNASTRISGVCPENEPPPMSDEDLENLFANAQLEECPPFPEKGDHPSEKDAHLSSGDKKPARKKPATTAFCAVPRPDDVDPQVWSDWMAVRKRKNKPLTETAFNFLKSQAEKAGISTARAIELCAQNGWLGFREEYLRNSFSRNSNSYQPAMKTPIKRKRAEDYVWKVK